MASPIVQVKDGAGAYAATTNGNNVTPGNTVTIALASTADVDVWSIACISTDDQSAAAAVNASLTIDPIGKTATFTAPVAGRAYRFQSVVNSGRDRNFLVQASYSTTFGIYTLVSGRRVIAVDETFESDPTFGWLTSLNGFIRNPAAVSAATTSAQGVVQLAGDLAGNGTTGAAPFVSGVTGNTSGYAQNSAPNGTQNTGNAKRQSTEYNINTTTPTTSATTILTVSTNSNRLYSVRGIICSLNSPVSAYSEWEINAVAVNNAGTLTVITSGGGVTNKQNVASFALTFTASGTNLLVTATDPSGGRRWVGTLYVAEAAF